MMANSSEHLQIGKRAEDCAREFLERKGLTFIQKNYTCRMGEVDLIMQDKNHVIFVEVRYRSREDYGTALESVNYFKQRKIIKAATHFLQLKNWYYKVHSRFDVIAIHPVNGEMHLDWIPNAFEAPW